jgi:hypothetical protein
MLRRPSHAKKDCFLSAIHNAQHWLDAKWNIQASKEDKWLI